MRKLFVEETLLTNINFDELKFALNQIDNEEYWLNVTLDDMRNIIVEPRNQDNDTFIEFELNEYDDLEQVTFSQLLDQVGITAYQLAKNTGLSTSAIYNFTSGDRELTGASLEVGNKIANSLGLNLSFLVDYLKPRFIYQTVQTDLDGTGDEEINEFKTVEESNKHAEYIWDNLTDQEQEKSWVYVRKFDVTQVDKEGSVMELSFDIEDNYFDSKN